MPFVQGRISTGAYKVFNDPDMFGVYRDRATHDLEAEWPTSTTAAEALESLGEFIDEAGFKSGRLLQWPKEKDGEIDERNYRINHALREIPKADPERLYAFILSSGRTILRWAPQWPRDYHKLRPQEVSVNLLERSKLARRSVLQPIIAATAMPDLRESLDQTLDEFAEYFPELGR